MPTAEELQKAKELIEAATNISVVPSPDFQRDSFPASVALFLSLKKLGKNVNLLAENYPERFKFLTEKEGVYPFRADFLITIREAGARLADLFYEKTENGLNLFLKTNGDALKKDNVVMESLSSRPLEDLFITIGASRLAKIEGMLKGNSAEIINIDTQLENENYGQANLVEVSSPALSEIVLDLLCLINEDIIDRKIANALLAGIVFGTSSFQNPRTNSQTFQKVSCLLEKGADLKETSSRLYGMLERGSLRIFGALINKIHIERGQNLAWALLKKRDFEKTGSSASDLKFALKKLSSGIFPFENFLVLWEAKSSPLQVRGVFYSPSQKMLEKILARVGGAQKGNGVLFQTKETDLEKVKDEILEIIT